MTEFKEFINNKISIRTQLNIKGVKTFTKQIRTLDLIDDNKEVSKILNNNTSNHYELINSSNPCKMYLDIDINKNNIIDNDKKIDINLLDKFSFKTEDIAIFKILLFLIINKFINDNGVEFKARNNKKLIFELSDVIVLVNEKNKYDSQVNKRKSYDSFHIIINLLMFKDMLIMRNFKEYVIYEIQQIIIKCKNDFKSYNKLRYGIKNIISSIDEMVYLKNYNKTRLFRILNNSKIDNDNNLINCRFNLSTDLKYLNDDLKNKIKKYDKPFVLLNKIDSLISYNKNITITDFTNDKLNRVINDDIKNISFDIKKIDKNVKIITGIDINDVFEKFIININKKFWNNSEDWIPFLFILRNLILPPFNTIYYKDKVKYYNKLFNNLSKNKNYDNITFLLSEINENKNQYGFNKLREIFKKYNPTQELIISKYAENIDKINQEIEFLFNKTDKSKEEIKDIIHEWVNKLKDFKSLDNEKERREFRTENSFNEKFIKLTENIYYSRYSGKLSFNPVFNRSYKIIQEDKTEYLSIYKLYKNKHLLNDLENYKDKLIRYDNIDDININDIFKTPYNFIKAEMGAGKTRNILIPSIEKVKKQSSNCSILLLTTINSLNSKINSELQKYNFISHQDNHNLKNFSNVICSIESLNKCNDDYDLVILDECVSIQSHFVSDTIKDKELVFNKFSTILNNSENVIFLDADIKDENIDIYRDILDINKNSNDYKIIEILPSKYKDRNINIITDNKQFNNNVIDSINNKNNTIIYSATKKYADDKLKQFKEDIKNNDIRDFNGTITKISGDGINHINYSNNLVISEYTEDKNEFNADIDKSLVRNNTKILLTTPSWCIGLSINTEYFKAIYGVASKHSLTARLFTQMLFRQRKFTDISLLYNNKDITTTQYKTNKRDVKKNLEVELNLLKNNSLLEDKFNNYYNEYELNNNNANITNLIVNTIAEKKYSKNNFFIEVIKNLTIRQKLKLNFLPVISNDDKVINIVEIINYNDFINAQIPTEAQYKEIIDFFKIKNDKNYIKDANINKDDINKSLTEKLEVMGLDNISYVKYQILRDFHIPMNEIYNNKQFINFKLYKFLIKNKEKIKNFKKLRHIHSKYLENKKSNINLLYNKNKSDIVFNILLKLIVNVFKSDDFYEFIKLKNIYILNDLQNNFNKLALIEKQIILKFSSIKQFIKVDTLKNEDIDNIDIDIFKNVLNKYLELLFLEFKDELVIQHGFNKFKDFIKYPVFTTENIKIDNNIKLIDEDLENLDDEDKLSISTYITEWYLNNSNKEQLNKIITHYNITGKSNKNNKNKLSKEFLKFIKSNIYKHFKDIKIYKHTDKNNLNYWNTFKNNTNINYYYETAFNYSSNYTKNNDDDVNFKIIDRIPISYKKLKENILDKVKVVDILLNDILIDNQEDLNEISSNKYINLYGAKLRTKDLKDNMVNYTDIDDNEIIDSIDSHFIDDDVDEEL